MSRDAVPNTEPTERAAVAAYVAELSSDLAAIARRHGLDTLGYILDMARLEAEIVCQDIGQNGG